MRTVRTSPIAGYSGSYCIEDALNDKVKGNRALSKEVKDVLTNKKRADLAAGRVSASPGYVLASDFCKFELAYLKYRYNVVESHYELLTGVRRLTINPIIIHFLVPSRHS